MSKCESGDGFKPAGSVPHLDAKPALAWSRSPFCTAREYCCLPEETHQNQRHPQTDAQPSGLQCGTSARGTAHHEPWGQHPDSLT